MASMESLSLSRSIHNSSRARRDHPKVTHSEMKKTFKWKQLFDGREAHRLLCQTARHGAPLQPLPAVEQIIDLVV
jgi:hypothetical protein